MAQSFVEFDMPADWNCFAYFRAVALSDWLWNQPLSEEWLGRIWLDETATVTRDPETAT